MILDVNDQTLAGIKNPALRSYAGLYVGIYRDFMDQIAQTGIEIDPQDYSVQVSEKVRALRKRGAVVRNNGKSIYIKEISPACVACQTGTGSATFFISLQCHRDCYYCFNPNQENYEYYREHTRDVVKELELIKSNSQRVRHLALTGGEPLLHKDETYKFFKSARDLFPDAYTRLYTCGDHANAETLQALMEAGLKEIRFSIRMHDLAKGQRYIYDRVALAKEYIPYVMIEMPVLPDTLEEMKDVLVELDRLGLFSINLLELCYPLVNAEVYREKGFKVKARPFRVLYNYWYAGGLPIARSELVCLDLIEFVLDTGLTLGVHYCSVENKQTGQVYQQNCGHPLPKTMYFSRRDYFLKTAKVFGDDIAMVKEFFEKRGFTAYQVNEEYGYLEFHVSRIRSLSRFDIEVGVSMNVLENRNGENVLRELKVDVTTPQKFQLSKDV
ncbi:MAG: radical SAM protein [Chloroflexota bacterium]